jgi:TDG/mug DNA glycosylase family protein
MLGAASNSAHVLPDLLKPGLKIVFCGTAAGNVSAARGAYYAHPQNRFWSALHAFGLTPRKLRPEDYAELPRWGLGLTDIAKHVSGMDRELPAGALGPDACATLKAKITAAEPEWLAFTSLTAGRRYLGRAGFGEQLERIGRTRLWVLPSPSPTAGWNWDSNAHWWRMLADAARSAEPTVIPARAETSRAQDRVFGEIAKQKQVKSS